MRLATSVLTLCVIVLAAAAAPADDLANLGKRLAVDLLLVRGEGELRGIVVSQSKEQVTFAVRREWMSARHPGWLIRVETAAQEQDEKTQEELKTRLADWKRDLNAAADRNRQLLATIGLAEEDAEKARKKAEDKKENEDKSSNEGFILVAVPAADVRRVIAQPAEKRQLASVAWEEKLNVVEETPAPRLQTLMDKADKTWPTRATKIASQLPGAPEGADEWSARTAIWEFQFGERVTFQGMGANAFRTDRSDMQPSLAQIVPSVLQGQTLGDLSSVLDGNLGGGRPAAPPADAARTSAITQAETAKVRAFRLTTLNMAMERNAVDVISEFVVRRPAGTWGVVWRDTVSENTATPRKEAEDRIRQDPQLAEALKITQALGVQGEIEKAIRVGAATMVAQTAIDGRFNRWVESMTQRLDGPPLTIQP